MGAWGTAAWENDGAADWFGDTFDATGLARRVEETLDGDPEDDQRHGGQVSRGRREPEHYGHCDHHDHRNRHRGRLASAVVKQNLQDHQGRQQVGLAVHDAIGVRAAYHLAPVRLGRLDARQIEIAADLFDLPR